MKHLDHNEAADIEEEEEEEDVEDQRMTWRHCLQPLRQDGPSPSASITVWTNAEHVNGFLLSLSAIIRSVS
jgi:hypothetical protein